MLRPLATLIAAAALLAPAAHADKFYIGPEATTAEEKASPTFIEGVLLRTIDDSYVIRVLGGEVWLPKAKVIKIEKDDLTVAALEQREQDRADVLAQANQRRREVQAAEASARRAEREQVQAREPAKTLTIVVDFQNLLPSYSFQTYDPVLHRANLAGLRQVVEDYLREEVLRAAHRQP